MKPRQQELELALLNPEQPPEIDKDQQSEFINAFWPSDPNNNEEIELGRLNPAHDDTRLEDLQKQRKALNKKWWKFLGLELILASGGIASIVGTVLLCKYFSDIKDSH